MQVSFWYILIFFISVVSVYFYRWYARKKTILDLPNERSSHINPTPRGGGIAIAILWFLAITIVFLRKDINTDLYFALLCGLPVSVVGLLDDVYTVSPKVRLLVQTLSATLAIFLLGGMNIIDIGFTHISFSFLFSIMAVIGVVWFTNLFNFLDGIDGYLSVEVIFIGVAFFLMYGIIPPLLLATVTTGFLVWNWQPAKIFMGDSGSTLLGFTIAIFAVYYQDTEVSSVIIWLMLTSLFWFDATLTLFRRWRNHENLSNAHKKHAYQRVVQFGFSHKKTVSYSLLVNLSILGLVWLAHIFPYMLLPLFCVNIVCLYILIRLVDRRMPFSKG